MKKLILAALLVATTGVMFASPVKITKATKHDTVVSDKKNQGTADDKKNQGTADDKKNQGTADDKKNQGTAD